MIHHLLLALTLFTLPLAAEYRDSLRLGEAFFNSDLPGEAALQYKEALKELESITAIKSDETLLQLRYRLAHAYYIADNFSPIPLILASQTNPHLYSSVPLKKISLESLHLTALAYQQLDEHEKALSLLQQYMDLTESSPQLQWELAISHYHLGSLDLARQSLNAIKTSALNNPKLVQAALLFEARIDVAEKKFKEAEQILSTLLIPNEDNLWKYEVSLLQGKIHFQLENYTQAAQFFEQSLPPINPERTPWASSIYYLLGWSYLKSAETSPTDLEKAFDGAEAAFTQLLELSNDENATLSLGNFYIRKGRRLNDPISLQKAEKLLANRSFTSQETQTQALLLRTEAASTYSERDRLYRDLTSDSRKETSLYAQAWYLRGLNDLEEGQRNIEQEKSSDACLYLEKSISSFQKAFDLLQNTDKTQAALALKYQAQAYLLNRNSESSLMALHILDHLSSQHPDLFQALADKDEILYLKGYTNLQLASHLQNDDFYLKKAKNDFEKQADEFPEGKYADDVLNLLGILAYQQNSYSEAKHFFQVLTDRYPQSAFAGDAFFWLSRCCEKLNEERNTFLNYRKTAFEKYPSSQYAPEAYFSYYSYFDYINGEPKAIDHLILMPKKFPKSPYLLNAYYLIGMDNKKTRQTKEGKIIHRRNLKTSIEHFNLVESLFDQFFNEKLLDDKLHYFINLRYRATIERALANLGIAEESKGAKKQIYLEYAMSVLQGIIDDFNTPDHPFTQLQIKEEPYPRIQEESEYGLAITYLKANQEAPAEEVFNRMLEKYESAKITRGYFLSRVWYEKGLLAFNDKHYDRAISFFSNAEDAGKGKVLNTEQKLELWIQQSLCYQAMNQLDKAMLTLSKVINEDAVSSLRLKAMVLRAEIYEKQGRFELARKQLETTAKKGGPWALKAKEKLEKDYAYQ